MAAALTGRLSLTSGLLLNEGTALLIIANGLRLLRRPGGSARCLSQPASSCMLQAVARVILGEGMLAGWPPRPVGSTAEWAAPGG